MVPWNHCGIPAAVSYTHLLPLYRSGSVKQVILHIQFFIGELSSPDRKAVLSLRLRYKPTFSLGVFYILFLALTHTFANNQKKGPWPTA